MAYVGLELPSDAGAVWSAVPGAQLHLTLAHFDKPTWPQTQALVPKLEAVAGAVRLHRLRCGSLEHWDNVGPVLIIEHDRELALLRGAVLDILMLMRIGVSTDYEWRPHITLGALRQSDLRMTSIKAMGLELCGCPMVNRCVFPFPD